jgi:magnesium transporter
VVLVPTLLAGIWGMNFANMPELDWQFGDPIALASIALAAYAVYRNLKRAGWL